MKRRTNSPAPDGRESYREALANAVALNPNAHLPVEMQKIADRFDVHKSTIYAATRDMRAKLSGEGSFRARKKAGKRQPRLVPSLDRGVVKTRQSRRPTDLTSMTVDDAARVLQVLSSQWPALRTAFLALDAALVKP